MLPNGDRFKARPWIVLLAAAAFLALALGQARAESPLGDRHARPHKPYDTKMPKPAPTPPPATPSS